MKRFMVEITKPDNYIHNSTEFEMEQMRFADLIHEQLLQQVNINTEMTRIWLVFQVESKAVMEEIMATIPICSSISRVISELR